MIEKEFEPAFPILDDAGAGLHLRHAGMDLRDYFAAKAMQSSLIVLSQAGCASMLSPSEWLKKIATESYEMADAMMKARGEQA